MKAPAHAASPWHRFDPTSVLGPLVGEWCLWSLVIKGQRNQFSGHLLPVEPDLPTERYVAWQGGGTYLLDETAYWATVNNPEPSSLYPATTL